MSRYPQPFDSPFNHYTSAVLLVEFAVNGLNLATTSDDDELRLWGGHPPRNGRVQLADIANLGRERLVPGSVHTVATETPG